MHTAPLNVKSIRTLGIFITRGITCEYLMRNRQSPPRVHKRAPEAEGGLRHAHTQGPPRAMTAWRMGDGLSSHMAIGLRVHGAPDDAGIRRIRPLFAPGVAFGPPRVPARYVPGGGVALGLLCTASPQPHAHTPTTHRDYTRVLSSIPLLADAFSEAKHCLSRRC